MSPVGGMEGSDGLGLIPKRDKWGGRGIDRPEVPV